MHHHDNPTGHMRPRQVRRILALMWFGAALRSSGRHGVCRQRDALGDPGGYVEPCGACQRAQEVAG